MVYGDLACGEGVMRGGPPSAADGDLAQVRHHGAGEGGVAPGVPGGEQIAAFYGGLVVDSALRLGVCHVLGLRRIHGDEREWRRACMGTAHSQ